VLGTRYSCDNLVVRPYDLDRVLVEIIERWTRTRRCGTYNDNHVGEERVTGAGLLPRLIRRREKPGRRVAGHRAFNFNSSLRRNYLVVAFCACFPSTVLKTISNICLRSNPSITHTNQPITSVIDSLRSSQLHWSATDSIGGTLAPAVGMALPSILMLLIVTFSFIGHALASVSCPTSPPQQPCTVTYDPSRVAQTGPTSTVYGAIVTTRLNVNDIPMLPIKRCTDQI
jgi:hypothetical protein